MAQIIALFDADQARYLNGLDALPFRKDIYGHATVKSALQRAQHDKCCFCEGRFHGFSAGDVEHFRPKAYALQAVDAPKLYPGYYWLAYGWDNLLFSCPNCNRSHKRNLFPLSNPSRRAIKRTDPIARERPLLIDPAGPDDPRDHIKFHQEVPQGRTKRGRATIEILKLDRPALNDLRRERLNQLKVLRDVIQLFADDERPEVAAVVNHARHDLQAAQQPNAIFSAMAQDFIGAQQL